MSHPGVVGGNAQAHRVVADIRLNSVSAMQADPISEEALEEPTPMQEGEPILSTKHDPKVSGNLDPMPYIAQSSSFQDCRLGKP